MEGDATRTKLIGCVSTKNEVLAMAAPHVDCDFFDFSLHACPDELHEKLQDKIAACQDYDLIILTYGRCSRVTRGLVSASVPLVLPNVHDCISLLLGSDKERQALTERNPALYFFSQGWLDYGRDPLSEYLQYSAEYGENKAQYLIQNIYGAYQEAVFIQTTADRQKVKECRLKVKQVTDFFGWRYCEIDGDLRLLHAMVKQVPHPDIIRLAPGIPFTLKEGYGYAD